MGRLHLVLVACLALVLCTSPVPRGGHERGPEAGWEPRTYSYGPLPRQRLVAYGERSPGHPGPSRAGLVIVHGGFWYQARSAGWNGWARHVAGAGLAVFNLDYRPSTEASWPAQRRDVLRALRWIAQRAGRFGVDPRRLVLLGSSAGGQLAANTGTYGAGGRRVAGVVALSPVADPYRSWRTAQSPGGYRAGRELLGASAARLAGCEPGPRRGGAREAEARQCRRVWRDMSAARHASGDDDPPMLLIHSRRDFVPVVHSDALRAAQLRRGMAPGDVSVRTVPGDGHGGRLLKRQGVERMVLSWIAAHTQVPASPAAPAGGADEE